MVKSSLVTNVLSPSPLLRSLSIILINSIIFQDLNISPGKSLKADLWSWNPEICSSVRFSAMLRAEVRPRSCWSKLGSTSRSCSFETLKLGSATSRIFESLPVILNRSWEQKGGESNEESSWLLSSWSVCFIFNMHFYNICGVHKTFIGTWFTIQHRHHYHQRKR